MADQAASPEELLHAARGGCGDALAQLLQHYRHYLGILARVHVGRDLQSKADPSDLVQDTLLEARRDFGGFQGTTEGEFLAWLRVVLAHNGASFVRQYKGAQARDVRRELSLQKQLDRSTLIMANFISPVSSPSENAVRAEAAVLLANALADLPDHYRDVIVLHHLQGRPLKDVAGIMNRSVDSIKKLLARALIRLQSVMKEPP